MSELLDRCRPIRDVKIRGKVIVSRIYRRVEGKELQAVNELRKQKGFTDMISHPYYYIVLEDPVIVNADELPDEVVEYFTSRFVSVPEDDETLKTQYYAISKENCITGIKTFMNMRDSEHVYTREFPMENELENGFDVTIGACIYEENGNLYAGFDHVLLDHVVRFSNPEAEAALKGALSRLRRGEKI